MESDPISLVLDTNIVLDLFVFDDPAVRDLKGVLLRAELRWIATQAMRDELERVLAYAHIARRMNLGALAPKEVLAHFDRHALLVGMPSRAPVICADADDQMFIDLAVAHRCHLLSKDAAVLSLQKRLALLGVSALAAFPAAP